MTGATTWCIVYNGWDHPLVIDEEGHSVDPGSFACARRSLVRSLIEEERLVLVDPANVKEDSNPMVKMAAEEVSKRNTAIDAEKEQDAPAPAKTASKKTIK